MKLAAKTLPVEGHKKRCARRPLAEIASRRTSGLTAFTLLEVMIAITIFFIAIFTILGMTSRSLEAARGLRQSTVDAGSLAANLSLTNRLDEGMESGDFGDLYPDYSWTRSVYEVSTNGLFQADFWVFLNGAGPSTDPTLSILLYRPDSSTRGGGARGGLGGGR